MEGKWQGYDGGAGVLPRRWGRYGWYGWYGLLPRKGTQVVIGAALVLSGPSVGENSRKQPVPGRAAAGGEDLLPGHPALLEPPLRKSHRQKKGRTKAGCYHQLNAQLTAYFIYLQLNPKTNSDQNPENQQKSFSLLTVSLMTGKNLVSEMSPAIANLLLPQSLNFAPLSSVQFCTCLVLFPQHPVCSPEIHAHYLTTLPGSALRFSSSPHAASHDSLLIFLCLSTLRWC